MKRAEIVSMWVVALALVGTIGLQSVIPDMQQHLPHGIQTLTPRVELTAPGVSAPMMPLSERTAPVLVVQAQRPAADIADFATNRVIRCIWRGDDGASLRGLKLRMRETGAHQGTSAHGTSATSRDVRLTAALGA